MINDKPWQKIILGCSLLLLTSFAVGLTPSPVTSEYVLPNGLKLIVREDHRAPVVVSMVWYKIGSSYEYSGKTGLSHVLEHMMFKGTKNLKPGEFSNIMARFGAEENAFTNYDATAYHQVMSADRLPLSFELEAERMHNLLLNEDEFKKELKVVMEERRLRTDDKPNALMYERFKAIAHQASTYGNPVIGWPDDLKHINVNDLKTWYNRWYSPNNAVVVVVGDVNPEQVRKLAQQYFGPIKAREDLPEARPLKEINEAGERHLTVKLPAQLPTLVMGFNVPAVITAQEEWEPYALRMLAGVLDGGYSARIESELVRGSEVAAYAGASYNAFTRGDTLFTLSGVPNLQKKHTIKSLEKALWQQLDKLKSAPPSQQELDRIKAQLISTLVYQQDSIVAQANLIGSLESIGLSWKFAEEDITKLEAVTPEQIQAVAKKYFTHDRLTVAILDPQHQLNSQPSASATED
ncbi:M16 family metallopeptidase [Zooshikella harenae]|uniref:Insulinase family protein n=1 Tax=Zooshikella harenae TaxID=2827238 RepID=A0ABS5ZGM8_9GAMM|nr:pitrilysin family protein [Zooshikella harenae]MBU2713216.1 insulinase family protein [Zooshikella harenae]